MQGNTGSALTAEEPGGGNTHKQTQHTLSRQPDQAHTRHTTLQQHSQHDLGSYDPIWLYIVVCLVLFLDGLIAWAGNGERLQNWCTPLKCGFAETTFWLMV